MFIKRGTDRADLFHPKGLSFFSWLVSNKFHLSQSNLLHFLAAFIDVHQHIFVILDQLGPMSGELEAVITPPRGLLRILPINRLENEIREAE